MSLKTSTDTQSRCRHCGNPIPASRPREDAFCCNGCAFVYKLIHEEGFDRFYDLRDKDLPPVKSVVFEQRDLSWLQGVRENAEREPAKLQSGLARARFDLLGISCIGCVWLVEKLFQRRPGSGDIVIQPQLGQLTLSWIPGDFDLEGFAREIQQFGYLLGPPGDKTRSEARSIAGKLGICGFFVMNAMLFTFPRYLGMEADFLLAELFELLALIFASLSLATGGAYFIKRAWMGFRARVLHIDLPIAIGIISAYLGSLYGWLSGNVDLLYFDFVALFIFLMLVGRYAQEWALEKNRNALLSSRPQARTVIPASTSPEFAESAPISVADLKQGDRFQLRSGQSLPLRATTLDPLQAFSLEWITGESRPVEREHGAILPAGAVFLGRGTALFEAAEDWDESLLARLAENESRQSHRNLRFEAFLRAYLVLILVLSLLGAGIWAFVFQDPAQALETAIALLVVSCPCAVGIALPLSDDLAAARLRRHGVFLREASLWTRLKDITAIAFDKTGTLTYDVPHLINPESIEILDTVSADILHAMVSESYHPVSRAIREQLLARDPGLRNRLPVAGDATVSERVGLGLEFQAAGQTWRLGRPGWAAPEDAAPGADTTFSRDGRVLSAFRFRESLREHAREEIAELEKEGFRVAILSGDRREKVESIGRNLGLQPEQVHGGLLPEDKAAWIRRHAPGAAMMVGDGANDALAFQAAHVTATPVIDKSMLEQQSDFYFLGRGLDAIRSLFFVHHRRNVTQQRVLAFTITYNVFTGAWCFLGMMNPLFAAILMPASSLVSLAIVLAYMRRGGLASLRAGEDETPALVGLSPSPAQDVSK